jgi:hypothetical protein
VTRVHLVHPREIAEVGQVDRGLDEALETAPRRLQDRLEIREDLLGLLLDRVADDLTVIRPQRQLARGEDEIAGANGL